ncbi:MAG TPA: translational GTPase TypA, partial [Firmicutes bacterium]|nr:translational GTPase TypA [Bacillota bacterium]
GHADFGGEVERIMNMVDGVVLVVDAFDGVMPQTRFVLKTALEYKLKVVVVINKVDRPNADIAKTEDEILQLFMDLGADDRQLDYKIVYCSALKGTTSYSPDLSTQQPTMAPILDTILKEIPAPAVDPNGPFQFQPSMLDYNDYIGRIGIGRVERGTVKVNDTVTCIRLDGSKKTFKVQKLYGYYGMSRIEIPQASAGEICAIGGLADIEVGETLCAPDHLDPLPQLRIDPPTLQMTFAANKSPFAGDEGKFVTAAKIGDRLFREAQKDVSLKYVAQPASESFLVSGRGELSLSVLIETMRREGYELEVSKPDVIVKEIDGVKCEPYEDLQIDVPDEYVGAVMQLVGGRSAQMLNMDSNNGQTRLTYVIPTRGLISFMSTFMTLTRGYGMINHSFKEYRPMAKGQIGRRVAGVLVSVNEGKSTSYALQHVEARGTMFIGPGTMVYEGMLVGENKFPRDMAVNVTEGMPLNNERSSTKDQTIVLKAARKMSLEEALDYINNDELVEVTPKNIRLRKKIMDTNTRKKYEAHHPEEYGQSK